MKSKTIFHKFWMSVPEHSGVSIVSYSDILWLQPCENYTQVFRNGKPSRYVYESLYELENILPPVFYRCHRSVIVNLCQIQSFDEHSVHINNHILPIAQKKKTKFRYLMEKSETLTFPLCGNCENCHEFRGCAIIRPFTAKKIT